jgi:hypothetical protein
MPEATVTLTLRVHNDLYAVALIRALDENKRRV